jgi:hypothetical protein
MPYGFTIHGVNVAIVRPSLSRLIIIAAVVIVVVIFVVILLTRSWAGHLLTRS